MMKLKQYLYSGLSLETRNGIRRKYGNTLVFLAKCIPLWGNLDMLAMIFGTDKNLGHNYTRHYARHFKKFRFGRVKLFEIGVGGYDDPLGGGQSLRMWKKYFPFGQIIALDLYDKSKLQENRIKIYQGSQDDPEILDRISAENGNEFDLIIDDGSHVNEHVITTFKLLFPMLKEGGIYVIEDLQTSYWEDFGGDNKDLTNSATSMNFIKSLTDGLNHVEYRIPGYEPTYFDSNITEIHFYHNIAFIYKAKNDEGSNVL